MRRRGVRHNQHQARRSGSVTMAGDGWSRSGRGSEGSRRRANKAKGSIGGSDGGSGLVDGRPST